MRDMVGWLKISLVRNCTIPHTNIVRIKGQFGSDPYFKRILRIDKKGLKY